MNHKIFNPIIAMVTLTFSFIIFIFVIKKAFPSENRDITMFVLGVVSSAVTTILSYYFGSSHGSAMKSEFMEKK